MDADFRNNPEGDSMTKVITVAHLREDTGKTITSVQFAYNLSLLGWRVLLLNFSREYQHKRFFEVNYLSPLADYEKFLEGSLDFAYHLSDISAGLWFLDASKEKILRVGEVLQDAGEEFKASLHRSGFDWIVIDTHPFPTLTTKIALEICDHLLLPTTKDFLAFKTLERTLNSYGELGKQVEADTVSILLTQTRGKDIEREDYARFSLKELVIGEIPLDAYNLIQLGWRGFHPGQKIRLRANAAYRNAVTCFLRRVE